MAEIIPREFIELLLEKVDIIDLINLQIPLRKKTGSNYFARCPFHQEKTGSFSVSQTKQFYYCFGCGAHGNAIDFMMNHDHLTFPEAVEALARHAGMEVPTTTVKNKKGDSIPALIDLIQQVADYYYDQMRHSERAINYLKKRGITGKIAKQFQIGFAQPGWSHVLDTFGKNDIGKKQLAETGLTIKKNEGGYYDRFRERIMFPIHDYRGRVIGFGGRVLDQGEPKYLNSPETPLFQKGHELYGLHQALKANRKLDRIMIVEGYMDVIALFQNDITYAVATLGTATTTHHMQRLFRYTSEIVFCFDGDKAGRTAAWRAVETIFPVMQDSLQVRFLFLPDGEDPDSLVQKEGRDAFEKRVASATSLSDFFFQTISKQADMNTMEGRARFAATALNHIKKLTAPIFQGMMVTELSKRSRVNLDELKAQIKTTGQTQAEQLSPAPDKTQHTKLPAPLRMAFALIVQEPSIAQEVKDNLPEAILPGVDLLTALVNSICQYNIKTTGMLMETWRDKKEHDFIAKMAQVDLMIPQAGMHDALVDALRKIQYLALEEEITRLMAKAAVAGLSDEEKTILSRSIARKQAYTQQHREKTSS